MLPINSNGGIMKPTLHSIAFKFTINKLRNYIISAADIYDIAGDCRYKTLRYISIICGGEDLHFLGRYHVTISTISYLANNAKITLHDIAD